MSNEGFNLPDEGVGLVMPEVIVKRVLDIGLAQLRQNTAPLNQVFRSYLEPEMAPVYGVEYVNKIKSWLQTAKIPTIYGFSENVDKVPSYTIHLSPEREDETKASMNDFYGSTPLGDVNVGVFRVSIDIGCHADKTGDYVIWLYYICNYLLFKYKPLLEKMGLMLVTFGASEQKREAKYASEVVFSRWISLQCTVANTWYQSTASGEIDQLETHLGFENDEEISVEI